MSNQQICLFSTPSNMFLNKAGYTANTCCRWVGRGGYARFPTFQLVLMDQQTEGRMDQRTDGWMDKAS